MNHNGWIQYMRNWNSIKRVAIAIGLAVVCVGCTSQETRWDSPILAPQQESVSTQDVRHEPTPVEITETVVNTPPEELIQTPIDIPVRAESSFENAWLMTSSHGLSLNRLAEKAKEYNVTQIQLGGDILQAVDDVILDENKRIFIQQVAERMETQGIKVLLNSREIHLEGRTFLFDRDDPLISARQAAYRKAFSFIPQLDGVVLNFTDAKMPVWDAVIPAGRPQLSIPERIRFVLDMIRPVVVDELGKWLYVRLEGDDPQKTEWIAQAMLDYIGERVVVVVPLSNPLYRSDGGETSLLDRFENQSTVAEIDLGGFQFGGPRFIVDRSQEWRLWQKLKDRKNVLGSLVAIDARNGPLFGSPNEANLMAFAHSEIDASPNARALAAEWIQKKYGIPPLSREGNLLFEIIRRSNLWNKKISFVKNALLFSDFGDLPSPGRWSLSTASQEGVESKSDFFFRQLTEPNKQLLVDLFQESFEANELLDRTMWDLESMRLQLTSNEYEDIFSRLEQQRLVADVFLAAKQAIWGFEYWKKTLDEDEALHLEAYLQKLERLASALEQRYGPDVRPGNPHRIREWISHIRSRFPRVILGWRERDCNLLKGITIQQTASNAVEIRWNCAKPSTSRVFVSTTLPVFDRMTQSSNFLVIEHKSYLRELDPGVTYYIQIQCIAENGDVTNSGIYPFELESSPVM